MRGRDEAALATERRKNERKEDVGGDGVGNSEAVKGGGFIRGGPRWNGMGRGNLPVLTVPYLLIANPPSHRPRAWSVSGGGQKEPAEDPIDGGRGYQWTDTR